MKCSDCKYLYIHDFITGVCEMNYLTGRITPEDYCSRGEKRVGKNPRFDNTDIVPRKTAVLETEQNSEGTNGKGFERDSICGSCPGFKK